jgi:hypothetical protein
MRYPSRRAEGADPDGWEITLATGAKGARYSGLCAGRESIWPGAQVPLHRPSESSLKAQDPPDIAQVNGSIVGLSCQVSGGNRNMFEPSTASQTPP